MRSVALALIAALLLVGCGGSAEPAKKAPPPKTYTAAELRAAMPEVKDVPGATKMISKCPGSPSSCPKAEDGEKVWTHNIELKDDGFLGFTVTENDSLLGAQQKALKQRKVFENFDGDFETTPEKLEDGYSPGLKGTGTFDEFSPGDWDGFIAERILRFTDLDGKTGDKTQDSFTLLRLGNATVSVIGLPDNPKLTPGVSRKFVEKIVDEFNSRLSQS